MMTMSEIQSLGKDGALKKIHDLRKELFFLKLEKHTGVMEKPHLVQDKKKDIARLFTYVNSKQAK